MSKEEKENESMVVEGRTVIRKTQVSILQVATPPQKVQIIDYYFNILTKGCRKITRTKH